MTAAYRYPLQTLQDLRETELLPVRAALANVEQRIERIDHEMASCRASMEDAQHSLRSGQAAGVVPIEQQRVVRLYLTCQRRELSRLADCAALLQSERLQCMDKVAKARSALRMLELHRARLAREHGISSARRQQRALDDGWLSRLRRRGGPA